MSYVTALNVCVRFGGVDGHNIFNLCFVDDSESDLDVVFDKNTIFSALECGFFDETYPH